MSETTNLCVTEFFVAVPKSLDTFTSVNALAPTYRILRERSLVLTFPALLGVSNALGGIRKVVQSYYTLQWLARKVSLWYEWRYYVPWLFGYGRSSLVFQVSWTTSTYWRRVITSKSVERCFSTCVTDVKSFRPRILYVLLPHGWNIPWLENIY